MIRKMVQRKHSDTKEDHLKNHFHAQKLNNIAASCIDAGQHGKAVTILVKALCLSPINGNSDFSVAIEEGDVCTCRRCSLDECITYSEERAATLVARKQRYRAVNCCGSAASSCISKKRRIDVVPTDQSTFSGGEEENEKTIGYTHRRPIYVPPNVCSEAHVMGSTLSLIITFNLALSSHLRVISCIHSDSKNEERQAKLVKVLRLYELAYRWQEKFYQHQHECNDLNSSCSSLGEKTQQGTDYQSTRTSPAGTASPQNGSSNECGSLRFDIIVCNNLSEIHRMLQNHSKQEKCLEHLLSLLMYVVDSQRDRAFENPHEDAEGNDNALEAQGNASHPEESDARNCNSSNASDSSPGLFDLADLEDGQETEPEQRGKRKRNTTYMQLEGFWKNITPFLLQNNCAEVA